MTETDPVKNPYTTPDTGVPGMAMSMRAAVRTGQIITFALIMATVVISAVMLMTMKPDDADETMLFVFIGAGFAFASIVVAFVITKSMRQRAIEELRANGAKEDIDFPIDQTMTSSLQTFSGRAATWQIVGQALCEGPAVMNAVFMMIDGQVLYHGIAILILVIGIAIQVPTLDKRQAMIDEALR